MKKLDPDQWPLDNQLVYYVKGSSDGYPVEGFATYDCSGELYVTGGSILRDYRPETDALYEWHPCAVVPMPLWDGIADLAGEPNAQSIRDYIEWYSAYSEWVERESIHPTKTTETKENNK